MSSESETVNASLAQVVESGIPIALYEALAIVQQICRALLEQPGVASLNRGGIFIQSTGGLTIQSSGTVGSETVQWLGELLRNWLDDTSYPMPLKLVVAQATCTPPFYTSIAELFEALSYYERPNRQELVRNVYDHWQSAVSVSGNAARSDGEAQPAPGEALESFQPEAVPDVVKPEVAQPEVAQPKVAQSEAVNPEVVNPEVLIEQGARPLFPPAWWNWEVARIAASVTAFVGISTWLLLSLGPGVVKTAVSAIHRTRVQFADGLTPVLDDALDWLSSRQPEVHFNPSRAAAIARRPEPSVEFQPLVIAKAPERGPDIATIPPNENPSPEPSDPSPAPGIQSVPPPLPSTEQPSGDLRSSGALVVYSAADTDVVPPDVINQQLSDLPPPAAQQRRFTALTIVVDENGQVESATLARKPATLQDAMLATVNLSAAKNWRFLPAVKDGQPVKYRRTVWVANR